eukprot:6204962-Pleurochrysis_carterae.AAC.3
MPQNLHVIAVFVKEDETDRTGVGARSAAAETWVKRKQIRETRACRHKRRGTRAQQQKKRK